MLVLVSLVLGAWRIVYAQDSSISKLFPSPDDLGEWQPSDSMKTYVGEDLFLHIDGGADLYLEYGFEMVAIRQFRKASGQQLTIEINAMTTPFSAYGIYSISAGEGGKRAFIGKEGTVYQYYLIFWKDRYFVTVVGSDSLETLRDELQAIGKAIADKIPTEGEKPVLSNRLPQDGLLTQRYVRGWIAISSIYVFDSRNIFGFREAVIGQYGNHDVFLFAYQDSSEAERSFNKAMNSMQLNGRYSGIRRLQERFVGVDRRGQKVCMGHVDNFILAVVAQDVDPVRISERILAHLRQTKP